MSKFLKVDMEESEEILERLSPKNTTIMSVDLLLDNRAGIKKKMKNNKIMIYEHISSSEKSSVFFLNICSTNKNLASIDFLPLNPNANHEHNLRKFIETIDNVYNVKAYLKYEERNDERIDIFRSIGFEQVGELREKAFYNGEYNNVSLLYKKIV